MKLISFFHETSPKSRNKGRQAIQSDAGTVGF